MNEWGWTLTVFTHYVKLVFLNKAKKISNIFQHAGPKSWAHHNKNQYLILDEYPLSSSLSNTQSFLFPFALTNVIISLHPDYQYFSLRTQRRYTPAWWQLLTLHCGRLTQRDQLLHNTVNKHVYPNCKRFWLGYCADIVLLLKHVIGCVKGRQVKWESCLLYRDFCYGKNHQQIVSL